MKERIGSLGGMRLPSYQDSVKLEQASIPHWINHFTKNKNVLNAYYFDNETIQKQEHWDILLVLRGSEGPKRVDVKTRSMSYFTRYQNDLSILVEVNGNTSRGLGSCIFNSNADLWAYAFFDGRQLVEPIVYDRKRFAEWLKDTKNFFPKPKNSNTDGLYETENVLIPKHFFKPFTCRWLDN